MIKWLLNFTYRKPVSLLSLSISKEQIFQKDCSQTSTFLEYATSDCCFVLAVCLVASWALNGISIFFPLLLILIENPSSNFVCIFIYCWYEWVLLFKHLLFLLQIMIIYDVTLLLHNTVVVHNRDHPCFCEKSNTTYT